MSDITWRTEQMRLGELKEWDRNPRQLTKHDYEHIGKSIETFGLADPLIVNADGSLIGGHQRKRVMLGNGATDDTLVDVRVPDRQLTEREAEELNVRLNRNTGDWDFDILANEFEIDDLLDWGFTEYDLEIGGFDLDEEPPEDPGAQVDRAEELREQWGVSLGQIWSIGQHKIICGDCTDADVVARLMGEERVESAILDPPYGMNLDTDYSQLSGSPRAQIKSGGRKHKSIIGDNEPFDARTVCGLQDTKEQFWFGADYYIDTIKDWHKGSWLVWDKRLDEDKDEMFGSHFELIWTKRKHKRRLLRLIEEIINRWCDGNIYDPFLGSGTTLVACERLGRIGRGIEISPAYVAVSLQRLADMGLEPELIGE